MTKLIIDIECTRSAHPVTGRDDPSPFNPKNKLVTVQWMDVDTKEKKIVVFHHKEKECKSLEELSSWDFNDGINRAALQLILNSSKELIGHNIGFDLKWLLECGFIIPEDCVIFDTMVFEYCCNKGSKSSLALKELAIKYNLPQKLDILQEYWEKEINTDEVPLKELIEYALQDLDTTHALYQLQRKRYAEEEDVKYMWPAIKLMNEALLVIVEMERNGCYIDSSALHSVESEYVKELTDLEKEISKKVKEVMGDTPINLSSADDMCKLLYGIEVKDKKVWSDIFKIGVSERNSVKKRRWPKSYKDHELNRILTNHTEKVYRTKAEQCAKCLGAGKVRKVKKNGEEFKRDNICTSCNGCGFIYTKLNKLAGLKLKPISSRYATAAGFAADKKVLEQYLSRESLSSEVKDFLKALQRQSAIKTYLDTFVKGIENNVREIGLLHTNLNQCITATGRLSSSNPNFQNLPRGSTFPVRKAIKSRFKDGQILEVDFAGLEYRVAVMLAGCNAGLESIMAGKDRHQVSAEIIFGKKKEEYSAAEWKEVRQNAKTHTFKPLYFGQSGTENEQKYYKAFMEEHVGIKKWHEDLFREAIENECITTPMGRIFAFPNVQRKIDGSVTSATQIVNYPVQSVATADLIWVVILDIYKEMKAKSMKSKLILQVHDAVLADVHPDEVKEIVTLFKKSFDKVKKLMYDRYHYSTEVPIDSEMKIGPNWGELKNIA